MKTWSRHSDWNYKNKVLLVEAEFYNTQKEFDKAANYYEAAIKSAHEHKFNPEEAIANELAGMFFHQREEYLKSHSFFKQSIAAYKKWGATAVAKRVKDSMSAKFSSDMIKTFPTENSNALPTIDLNESKKRQCDD